MRSAVRAAEFGKGAARLGRLVHAVIPVFAVTESVLLPVLLVGARETIDANSVRRS